MRVFSASIESFLARLTVLARSVLEDDFGVRVGRTRFRTSDGYSWPIALVAIDDADRLAYFDPSSYTIGVHKRLMYTAKQRVLVDLLRHEFAHYFVTIEVATGVAWRDARAVERDAREGPHGPHFQSVCSCYGLSDEVRRASIEVLEANDAIEGELEREAAIATWRRLVALSESDNEHEASLAVLRANELMVKHNLESVAATSLAGDEIEYCVKRVLTYRRSSPRMSAIAEILAEFLVYPVHASEGLEVTGTRENVEQAEYVANYLNRALRAAWQRARRESEGKRLREKPFMAAAAAAYVEKLQRAKRNLPTRDQKALVVLDEELAWAGHGIYGGGVHSTTTTYRTCQDSTRRGARAGSQLEIRRGVSPAGSIPLLSD